MATRSASVAMMPSILFSSIFGATEQCLPKPDVLDSSPSLNKLEDTVKKLFNASEEVEEKDAMDSGTASDHQMTSYNSSDTTTVINDLKRRDENSAEEPFNFRVSYRDYRTVLRYLVALCRLCSKNAIVEVPHDKRMQ
uniref:Uncharacterized protein n=1 Tax=Setaria digitata TaxID=48799 RepID=A0A915Q6W2_9BILA